MSFPNIGSVEKAFKREHVAVLALDIVDFSSASVKQQKRLIYYFNYIVTQALNAHKELDYSKIMAGDAVILIFDTKEDEINVYDVGITILLAIKASTEKFNKELCDDTNQLHIRYGADAGHNYKINPNEEIGIKTPNHFGTTVNTAWRMMSAGEPDTILITKKFYDGLEEIDTTDSYDNFRPVGSLHFKGVGDKDAYIYSDSSKAYKPPKFIVKEILKSKEVVYLRQISKIVSDIIINETGNYQCHRASLLLKDEDHFCATHRIEEFHVIPGKIKCMPFGKGLPSMVFDQKNVLVTFNLPSISKVDKDFESYIKVLNNRLGNEKYYFHSKDKYFFGRHCQAYISIPLVRFDPGSRNIVTVGIVSIDFMTPVTDDAVLGNSIQYKLSTYTAPIADKLAILLDENKIRNNIKSYEV